MKYSIQEIHNACRGQLIAKDATRKVRGVCIDSRIFKKGQAFIAVRGKSQDGHQYIPQVLKQGAVLIIADHVVETGAVPLLIVKDTTRALGEIARMHRRHFNVPVVALTGSAGKTTTKEMIAAVLSRKFKVLKNYKNENNWYGVPLTLLKLNASHEMVVLEMGTNQPGDIAWMSYLAQPDVAVLTNVGESHLEKLKTPAGVFREKLQITKFMNPEGTVIFNADDKYWKKIRNLSFPNASVGNPVSFADKSKKMDSGFRGNDSIKKVSCGLLKEADVHGKNISSDGIKQLTFQSGRESFAIRSPFQHNVHNALAAVACGRFFKVSIKDIQSALARFKFEGGRQDFQKIKGAVVINDTYNSNPVSFRSAVQTLDALKIKGKKILVCADMKELGPHAEKLHKDMGSVIRRTSIDVVFSFGELARHMTDGLKSRTSHPLPVGSHFSDLHQLIQSLKPYLVPGNAILVKGSRSMKMERVVEGLR